MTKADRMNGSTATPKRRPPPNAAAFQQVTESIYRLMRTDPPAAVRLAKDLVKLDRRDFTAHRLLGQALAGARDYEGALVSLHRALALNPDVIFFVTDADELKPAQIATITQLNHGRTAIHAIELSSRMHDDPDTPLQLLTRANHGAYRRVAVEP